MSIAKTFLKTFISINESSAIFKTVPRKAMGGFDIADKSREKVHSSFEDALKRIQDGKDAYYFDLYYKDKNLGQFCSSNKKSISMDMNGSPSKRLSTEDIESLKSGTFDQVRFRKS